MTDEYILYPLSNIQSHIAVDLILRLDCMLERHSTKSILQLSLCKGYDGSGEVVNLVHGLLHIDDGEVHDRMDLELHGVIRENTHGLEIEDTLSHVNLARDALLVSQGAILYHRLLPAELPGNFDERDNEVDPWGQNAIKDSKFLQYYPYILIHCC